MGKKPGPKKGQRFGGRKKGTPNRDTQTLAEKAKEIGADPFETLILFAKGDWSALGYDSEYQIKVTKGGETVNEFTISPELRKSAASDACQYLYPKRKALEVTGAEGQPLSFVQLVKECSGDDPGRTDS